MELNKMVGTIITLSVVIISVAAIMMPVLNAATAVTSATFTNEGYFDVKYSEEEAITVSWARATPTVITVNDTELTLSAPDTGKPRTIVCGDDWFVRYWKSGSIYGVEYTDGNGNGSSANTTGSTDFSLTASEGTLTVTGSNTVSHTYTYIYCVDDDGAYIMKDASTAAYMNGDSLIYAMGNTANTPASGITTYLKTTGSITDGLTPTVFYVEGTTDTITAATPVLNYSAVDGYEDLYAVEGFTVDVTDGTNTSTVTYTYFIVPAEVTAVLPEHLGSAEIALINAIPALVLVSLVMVAVGLSVNKRND